MVLGMEPQVSCFLGKYFIPGLFLQPVNVAFDAVRTPVFSGFKHSCIPCYFQPIVGSPHLDSLVWSFSKLEESNPVFILLCKIPFLPLSQKQLVS